LYPSPNLPYDPIDPYTVTDGACNIMAHDTIVIAVQDTRFPTFGNPYPLVGDQLGYIFINIQNMGGKGILIPVFSAGYIQGPRNDLDINEWIEYLINMGPYFELPDGTPIDMRATLDELISLRGEPIEPANAILFEMNRNGEIIAVAPPDPNLPNTLPQGWPEVETVKGWQPAGTDIKQSLLYDPVTPGGTSNGKRMIDVYHNIYTVEPDHVLTRPR